jgi:hypothetical protein
MAKIFEKLIFGGLHENHAVQRGIWVPTQHLLWDQGKPRKTLIELATFRGVRVRVTFRLTVSQSVSLGVKPILGLLTRNLSLSGVFIEN